MIGSRILLRRHLLLRKILQLEVVVEGVVDEEAGQVVVAETTMIFLPAEFLLPVQTLQFDIRRLLTLRRTCCETRD
jgi:hypothetical protein